MRKILFSFIVLTCSLLITTNTFAAVSDTGKWIYDGDDSVCIPPANNNIVYNSFESGEEYIYDYRKTYYPSNEILGASHYSSEYFYDENNVQCDKSMAKYIVLDYTYSKLINLPVFVAGNFKIVQPGGSYSLSFTNSSGETLTESKSISNNVSSSITLETKVKLFSHEFKVSGELKYSIEHTTSVSSTRSYTYSTSETHDVKNDSKNIQYARYEIRTDCYAHQFVVFKKMKNGKVKNIDEYIDFVPEGNKYESGLILYEKYNGIYKRCTYDKIFDDVIYID